MHCVRGLVSGIILALYSALPHDYFRIHSGGRGGRCVALYCGGTEKWGTVYRFRRNIAREDPIYPTAKRTHFLSNMTNLASPDEANREHC